MAIRDTGLPPREPGKPYLLRQRKHSGWRKVAGWAVGLFWLLNLLSVIALYVALHSTAFHNYVIRTAEQKASAALNTRVTIQNYALSFSKLGLDLYGLTVYGVGPGAGQPLLQAEHAGVGVRIISLAHRQWNFDNVSINRPVVNLIVDAQGNSNIPTPQSSGSSSNTNLIDLAVQHVLLDRGTVYYNDRKMPLSADLRDLTLRSSHDATNGGRYFGTLSYRDGHLQYGTYAPVAHDFDAQFDAQRGGMTLNKVTLKLGQSQLLLNASLQNYASPKVHASYVVMLAVGELRGIIKDPSLPSGIVLVNGNADYANVQGQPALESTTLTGTIQSQVLQVRTPSLSTDIRDVGANYTFSNGNAELRNVSARLLGGALKANATVRDVTGKQQGHVVAALRGISLADLKRVANSAGLKPVLISGYVNANSDATWTGNINNVQVKADAIADGKLAPAKANPNGGAMPLKAEVHARYNGQTQEVALNKSYVRMPHTSLDANGTVSRHSALEVNLQSNDLHELETVADIFSQPGTQPLNLSGQAAFNGTVRGSTSAPQIAGQLNAKNVQVRGSSFRLLRTSVQASPTQASLQNGDLELGTQQGRITFDVQTGLHNWAHTQESAFAVKLNASQVSVAELTRAANVTMPMTGTLNANIVAHGTQLNPIGQGEINLRNANVSGEPVKTAQVKFQGTGDAVHANLLVQISAGDAKGELTYYPKQEGYDAILQATNIQLAKIQALRARNLDVAGVLNLKASGRGTLNDPQGTVSLTIPELDVQKQQIRNVDFRGDVAHHEATFKLVSEVVSTPLRAQGKIALAGDYNADVSLDTPVIPLQPILAAYAPAQAAQISGQTEIHATLRGPLKNQKMLEAHLNVPTLGVTYRTSGTASAQAATLQLAAATPIRADYVDGVLTLQPGQIKGTATDVRFQGRLPLNSSAQSTLSVQGGVDLAIAQLFDPTLTSSGKLVFDINAAGYRSQPDVEGQIRIVNASFATPDAPVGLSNGNGVLTLRRDRLDITSFSGNVGGGTVNASGGVTYQPKIQFAIGLKGNDLRLLYPTSVRTDLGLNLAMTGNMDAALVQGQVNINQIYFTPDFDLTSFMNEFGGVATPPPMQGFADNVKLNIAVRSASELNAVSPTVSVQGAANLRVIGTAAEPVIVGRANLTGGDMIFMGNRYIVQGGTVAFVNSMETEPVVNLQASTRIQQYNISMRFRGPLDRLQTNYTSDPSLPSADIIHLLAFGNTEEAANAAPSQSTTQSAEALVASQVSSQVTSRLQKALGVSQISLDPQLGATTGNQQQGARLTVRQRVSGKMYVTFSTDVTTTQFSAIQVQYELNRKWSLSGVRNENGGFGLDGRYHKDF
jgi:translocation and assembly module TamB